LETAGTSLAAFSMAGAAHMFLDRLKNSCLPAATPDFFEECSKTSSKPPSDVSDFLPWKMSAERKQAFALPDSYF